VSRDNPYAPPAARVADRQSDAPTVLPRVAAVLAFLFAGGVLLVLLLEIARSPAQVRLIEHVDMLGLVLATALVGLGLWRQSPWGWWIGLLGAGYVLVRLVLRVRQEWQLVPGPDVWLVGLMVVAFLAVLLLPRTIRAFTR
jgi:hypothetical protein